MVEQAQEKLAYLLKSELHFTVGALLDENARRLELSDTVVTEECITLRALVRLCRYLITDDTLECHGVDLNVFGARTVQLYLCFRQRSKNFLYLCASGLHISFLFQFFFEIINFALSR